MCNNNDNNTNNNCSCFTNILCTIVGLQKQGQCCDNADTSCDRPYLGVNQTGTLYNTRPVTIYACGSTTLWQMPYTLNGTTATSSVFRVESAEDCCATFRILAPNPDTTAVNPYVATDSFFTMNLNCVGTLKCLNDTYVACI